MNKHVRVTSDTARPERLDSEAYVAASSKEQRPVLAIRKGRGRLGGSSMLDLLIQRARHNGRRARPLDGDLRSSTLAMLYPATDTGGQLIEDAASRPTSEELPAMKAWLMESLDAMAEDRVSRLLDLGGGDRVVQEFVRDLPLVSYCRDFGIDLLSIYMLGPDIEDFRHVIELIGKPDPETEHTLLVFNEGVIRQGQSPDGVFDPLMRNQDMLALLTAGARCVFMRRLTCMDIVRASGQGYYDIAEGLAGPDGSRPRATLQHMTKVWLQNNELEHVKAGTTEWLP